MHPSTYLRKYSICFISERHISIISTKQACTKQARDTTENDLPREMPLLWCVLLHLLRGRSAFENGWVLSEPHLLAIVT